MSEYTLVQLPTPEQAHTERLRLILDWIKTDLIPQPNCWKSYSLVGTTNWWPSAKWEPYIVEVQEQLQAYGWKLAFHRGQTNNTYQSVCVIPLTQDYTEGMAERPLPLLVVTPKPAKPAEPPTPVSNAMAFMAGVILVVVAVICIISITR
jgi:hypothetical protein